MIDEERMATLLFTFLKLPTILFKISFDSFAGIIPSLIAALNSLALDLEPLSPSAPWIEDLRACNLPSRLFSFKKSNNASIETKKVLGIVNPNLKRRAKFTALAPIYSMPDFSDTDEIYTFINTSPHKTI